jgi:hypothetical protein
MTNIVKLSSDYKRERDSEKKQVKEKEEKEKEEKEEKEKEEKEKEKTKEELFKNYLSCMNDSDNKQCNEILITILQKMEIM